MKAKKLFSWMSILVLIALVLSACAKPTEAPAPEATTAPAAGSADMTIAGSVVEDDKVRKRLAEGYLDAGAK
jgi:uncharacterized lipoprotein YbaY